MNHYGFNMLPMVGGKHAPRMDDAELDFVAEHGFNYIRLPLNYTNWIHGHDYFNPDGRVLEVVDTYVAQCLERGLHANINFHRAPGYCINRPDMEKHNLWTDAVAQDAFVFNWEVFARRYKHIPPEKLSFNLVNEPLNEGQLGITREGHAAIMRRAIGAIRTISPARDIVLDGMGGGHLAIPELAGTGTIHSVRGYTPFQLTHYQAEWCPIANCPEPAWPLPVDGAVWNREKLAGFYKPWRDVEAAGTRVMSGEFGCYNKVPNSVALAWFADLLGLYREYGWGYVLWNLNGPFGVINHGRPGTNYTRMNGLDVDAELLALLKDNRV